MNEDTAPAPEPTEAQLREMFPYAWALADLRALVVGRHGASPLDRATHAQIHDGDDTRMRQVLHDVIDAAQRALDTIDEPVTAEGRDHIEREDRP